MKKLSIIVSALLLALCCVGCNDDKNNNNSNVESTTSATETQETTINDDTGIKEIPMDKEYLAKILTIENDVPKYETKDSATESDFIGLWECQIAVNDDVAYSGMYGAPLYAIDKLEINDNKTGKIISAVSGSYGFKGLTETEFTWAVSDNKFVATVGSANVEFNMTPDNQIVLGSKDPTDSNVYAYYSKVDKFTDFDFSTVNFSFDDLAK